MLPAPLAGDGFAGAVGAVPDGGAEVPCSVIVTACPATVRVACREVLVVFDAAVATTVAFPVPALLLSVTQLAFDVAVHVQVPDVATLTCVPPPEAGSDAE